VFLRRAFCSLSFGRFAKFSQSFEPFTLSFSRSEEVFVQIWKIEEFNEIHAKFWLKKNINE